jgi:microcystin-dependent protein
MNPYLGEIRAVGFTFAPTGWALCNGQIMPIVQNTALFSLLGTQFGGDGKSNFALPNLMGTSPRGQGQGPGLNDVQIGEQGGVTTVTLNQNQMPNHTHPIFSVSAAGTTGDPSNATFAESRLGRVAQNLYKTAADGTTTLNAGLLTASGGNAAHNNLPPYLVVNFIIALQGVFPVRP